MTSWPELHAQARYRPRYPEPSVVRWLSRLPGHGLALDIGAGAGRHTKLLTEFGYTAVATDISLEGLRHVGPRRRLPTPARWQIAIQPSHSKTYAIPVQANMAALPFKDGTFDVALAYASLYYSRKTQKSIDEMARILKPGACGFVSLRTTDDHVPSRGEGGMAHLLVPEEILGFLFHAFSNMRYERCDTTRSDRTELDSEWLVSLIR